jgi:hypothetical protein
MSQEEIDYWADVKSFEPIVLEYRLHYNNDGNIVQCTMIQHPESTQYIVVDRNTYDNYFRYRIANGKLILITQDSVYHVKLTQSTVGFPVVKNHANLLLEVDETYKEIEYYDHRHY